VSPQICDSKKLPSALLRLLLCRTISQTSIAHMTWSETLRAYGYATEFVLAKGKREKRDT
jgi:hypothetical protein